MATRTITTTLAKNPPQVPEGKRKLRVFDDKLRGFIMEVRATGIVTFWYRYTGSRGETREVKIGRFGGPITVDKARKKAEELTAQVHFGGDPGAERDRRRAVPTFERFVEDQYLPHAKETLRAYADYEVICRKRLIKALGRKAMDEVTQADVAALRRGLIEEGLSNARVNRHLAVIRRIFNLALKWEVYEGRNPANSPNMLREQHRERFLTETETRALMVALDHEQDHVAASAIALLMLTGARKNEVLKARWDDVDFDRRLLKVPLSKNGRARYIPLSDGALRILRSRPQEPEQPFVFPSVRRPGHPVEDVRGAWRRVKVAAGFDDDLRLHDLRHNFASLLVNGGRSLQEVGAILGHRQLSTTTRYAHLSPDRLIDAANIVGRIANQQEAGG